MRKTTNIISVLAICIVFFTNCTEDAINVVGQGTITGRVVEAETFEPIENAKVTISPTNNATFSDEDGNFILKDVPEGDYSAQAEKDGYLAKIEPVTVTEGNDVNVIFEMDDETALNKPPSIPVLISPEDNATGQNISVELVWHASSDPDENDELVYDVTVRNDKNNDVIFVESLKDTTYVLENLKYGTKYFWQITVSDDVNDDVLSPIHDFTTDKYPNNRFFFVKKDSINENNIIYSANADDSNTFPLTTNDQNSWRPRMNRASGLIAFLRTINTETHIFTMNPDGSGIKQVTQAVPVVGFKQGETDFSWSGNGDRIIYANFDKLYLINKDGSGLQQIYQTTDGSFITECSWSFDESFIALKTNDNSGYNVKIYTIDMAGTVLKTILSGVNGAAGGLDISVDNQRLLYSYDISGYEDASYRQLNNRLFIYNLVTDEVADISSNKVNGTNDLDPRFSPNEASVIFVNTSNDGISQKDIYTMDAGGGTREKAFENAIMPDWE